MVFCVEVLLLEDRRERLPTGKVCQDETQSFNVRVRTVTPWGKP
jgi:hypothetical protein